MAFGLVCPGFLCFLGLRLDCRTIIAGWHVLLQLWMMAMFQQDCCSESERSSLKTNPSFSTLNCWQEEYRPSPNRFFPFFQSCQNDFLTLCFQSSGILVLLDAKCVCGIPDPSPKNLILHVLPLWDGKRTKSKGKLNESTRRGKITQIGLFHGKI